METLIETIIPEHYNPDQLVTYRTVNEGSVTYPTVKVSTLEYNLDNYRYVSKGLGEYRSKVGQLEERLSDYLDMDSEDIVSDICSIFGFNPTKQIEFEATATITGTITIPLADVADFDIGSVDLSIDVSAYSYEIDDISAEVDHITTL